MSGGNSCGEDGTFHKKISVMEILADDFNFECKHFEQTCNKNHTGRFSYRFRFILFWNFRSRIKRRREGIIRKNDGFLFAYSITSGNCDLQTNIFYRYIKYIKTGLMFRTDTSDSAPFCAFLYQK